MAQQHDTTTTNERLWRRLNPHRWYRSLIPQWSTSANECGGNECGGNECGGKTALEQYQRELARKKTSEPALWLYTRSRS
jgi:hypothetical protein